MALVKGAKKCFEWLRGKKSGQVVTRAEAIEATGWNESSLKTYLNKNKLAPFLAPIVGGHLKVLLDGSELSEPYFDEVFTQTAPTKVTLGVGGRLAGEHAVYTLHEPLGHGAVGQVWAAAVDGDASNMVAVKIMLPRDDLLAGSKIINVRQRFRREARNGRKLDTPYIVKYLDLGEVQKNPFLVMELGHQSVGQFLRDSGPMSLAHTSSVVLSVVEGLRYLHAMSCPHRDVKPDNIMGIGAGYKLADLGIVKWTDFDKRFTTGGTITRSSIQLGSWFYMAPEQQQNPHEAVPASDIYALGISWIEMLTGNVPAPQSVGAAQYPRPSAEEVVCEQIKKMVAYSPDSRSSLEEIASVVKRFAS